MTSVWLNVRIGRYFVQAWGAHLRVLRMTDVWMLAHGQRRFALFTLFGYRR